MTKCTVLCADSGCKHNSGSGYYGVCHHPITKEPHYTGGIDRLYRETCGLRESEDDRIIISGGGRGGGKLMSAEAMKKYLEENGYDCIEINRGTGKSGSSGL